LNEPTTHRRAGESWQQWYADHMRLLATMKGAVTRMLKRKLSMAWEQWQFWYEDLLRQRDLLASAMARIQKLKLSQMADQATSRVSMNLLAGTKEEKLRDAASENDMAKAQQLLNNGVNVDAKDAIGRTALCLAAQKGHDGMVDMLLQAGADLNVADKYGDTPMHSAAENGHDTTVAALFKAGADPNRANNRGQTPKDMAAQRGHSAIVTMIKHATAESVVANQVKEALLVLKTVSHRGESIYITVKTNMTTHEFEISKDTTAAEIIGLILEAEYKPLNEFGCAVLLMGGEPLPVGDTLGMNEVADGATMSLVFGTSGQVAELLCAAKAAREAAACEQAVQDDDQITLLAKDLLRVASEQGSPADLVTALTAWKLPEEDAERVAKSLQDVGLDNLDDLIEFSGDEADFAMYLQTELGVKKFHASKIMRGIAASKENI